MRDARVRERPRSASAFRRPDCIRAAARRLRAGALARRSVAGIHSAARLGCAATAARTVSGLRLRGRPRPHAWRYASRDAAAPRRSYGAVTSESRSGSTLAGPPIPSGGAVRRRLGWALSRRTSVNALVHCKAVSVPASEERLARSRDRGRSRARSCKRSRDDAVDARGQRAREISRRHRASSTCRIDAEASRPRTAHPAPRPTSSPAPPPPRSPS